MTPRPTTLILWAALAALALYYIRKTLQLMKTEDPLKPLFQPVAGRVSSPFGTQRTGHTHSGTDIAVPVGTPVVAPWPGTVAGVYDDITYGGGLTVIVKHPNGYRTGYCHLSRQLVSQGQQVGAGETLALSGNTGHSTGPHLHFSLTNPQGQKIDPETFFSFQA